MVSVPREVGYASRCKFALQPCARRSSLATLFSVYYPCAAPIGPFNPFPFIFLSLSLFLSPSSPSPFLHLFRIGAGIFGQVLRSMPRGRRFRVPPSAQRSSFDPFAVQAACAQGATPRKGSLVRPRRAEGPEISDLYLPRRLSFDFTASLENESDTL